jgi:RimJ/RimL family protein N-acetyltransferase
MRAAIAFSRVRRFVAYGECLIYIRVMAHDDIRQAPAQIITARTTLRLSSLDMVDVRVEWAVASSDMLEFTWWWRKGVDREKSLMSLQSEMSAIESGEELIYNVFESTTNAYVGRIDLHSWDFDAPRCEIGYMADARTCGRGLLREAALACVDLAFKLGAVRVQAITDSRNLRSIHFAKLLGMQEEGVLRNYERDGTGSLTDQVMLSVTRSS